jgi:hypothetical protein
LWRWNTFSVHSGGELVPFSTSLWRSFAVARPKVWLSSTTLYSACCVDASLPTLSRDFATSILTPRIIVSLYLMSRCPHGAPVALDLCRPVPVPSFALPPPSQRRCPCLLGEPTCESSRPSRQRLSTVWLLSGVRSKCNAELLILMSSGRFYQASLVVVAVNSTRS